MSETYDLMNLDMGEKPEVQAFTVGPYKIKLKPDYGKLYLQLSQNATTVTEFGDMSGKVHKTVTKKESTVGAAIVTATVTCETEPPAILVSESFNTDIKTTGIWDLCLILSFLTGKRVFLPSDERRFRHVGHGEGAVQDFLIPKAAELAWINRIKFTNEKQRIPLWYFLNMNDTPEAQLKLLLGCVSLEVIQGIEKPEEKMVTSTDMKALIDNLKNVIDQSTLEDSLKGRLKGAVGNWGGSSASEMFKLFLITYGIIDDDISGIPLERVNGVFQLRNGVAHTGEIRKPKWTNDPDEQEQIAIFIAGVFIPYLIQEYINRRFGIVHLPWPSKNKELLREFIYRGTWDGETQLSRKTV